MVTEVGDLRLDLAIYGPKFEVTVELPYTMKRRKGLLRLEKVFSKCYPGPGEDS